MKLFNRLSFNIFLILALISCNKEEEGIIQINPSVNINGFIQKGPFINGTTLLIAEMDDSLQVTGKTFTTQIVDNKGTFQVKTSKLDYFNVQLVASGFYFDEVKGKKSEAQLTLFALANVSEAGQINVNVLSHLEKDRVMKLISQGKSFAEAKQQALHEILAIFGIEKEEIANAEAMDISKEGDDNAILLAISAILQGDNSVAGLTELLATINSDIINDGTLDDDKVKEKLKNNAIQLNLPAIRQFMEKRYNELEVEATIPNFEKYIDSDGDGILNKDEDDMPEDFEFILQEHVPVSTKITSNEVTITGISEEGYITATISNAAIVKNNQVLQDSVVNLKNGDKIKIQIISGENYQQTSTAEFSLGILKKHFKVITDKYTPDEFIFNPVQQVDRNASITSQTITITGIPHPTPAKITNGMVFKNDILIQIDTFTVQENDKLQIQVNSSENWGGKATATLQVGQFSADFSVITLAYPWASAVTGYVQAGPFIQNSSLTFSETDSLLNNTGKTTSAKITDNTGNFGVSNLESSFPFALATAKGYFFNFISNKATEGELELSAYSDISSGDTINVNLITHLESRRVKYLVNAGLSFSEAKKQALQEVLKIFEITENVSKNSENFSLTDGDTESAMLIAITSILQGNDNTGALHTLLTSISIDLEKDGILNEEYAGSSLINNAYYIDTPTIRKNLINKYKELGKTVQFPDFEKYIKNFIAYTSFKFTNPIVYPETGRNGNNILTIDANTFKATKSGNSNYFSLAARLPNPAKLKIVIKGGLWYYILGSSINWAIDTYDYVNKSQVFTSIENGKGCDLQVSFPINQKQTLTIEYYEYGSSQPTRIKKITVTP